MSTIKCSKCDFRGAQTDFPRKPNLGYMKTCSRCTERRRNAAAAKRQDISEKDGSKKKKQTLGKDSSPQGLPTLTWDEFLCLLSENTNCAFELDAFVTLTVEGSKSSKELATDIAQKVWEAVGFPLKAIRKRSRAAHRKESMSLRSTVHN